MHDVELSPGRQSPGRAFKIGVVLNVAFVATEAAAGFLVDSLALLADAGHNLSDVLGLLLAWGAMQLAQRRPTAQRTYGLRRTTILAALANAVLLLVAAGAIAWEAFERLAEPRSGAGIAIMLVAFVGVIVNGITALLFIRGRREDLNVRGAFVHMVADAAISAGVVVAGLLIRFTGAAWIDPVTSLAIAAIIAIGTWDLLRDSINLVIDAVPGQVDLDAVKRALSGHPGISDVHHLHVWAISTTEIALTAHLVKPDGRLDDALLRDMDQGLRTRFGIHHATLQLEQQGCGPGAEDCPES
jgi:cobalt-zinc-cadmium efflux system protein